MSYATLLVHLDGGQTNAPVLAVTARLAERYQAKIVGVAACQPMQIGSAEGDLTGALVGLERDIVTDELERAQAEFRGCVAIQPYVLDWRSSETFEPVSHIVAEQASCADLVITSLCAGRSRNALTHADAGDLVIRAGRPVLIVPDEAVTGSFERIVVAWANTRECRRAIVDALPILKRADQIIIVQVATDLAEARSQTKHVMAWLSRHHVGSDQLVVHPNGHSAKTLQSIIIEHRADLVVAGAYGHNRLREWAFGGLTRVDAPVTKQAIGTPARC